MMEIEALDPSNAASRSELVAYLSRQETQCLFLLGNLLHPFGPSWLYAARSEGKLVGVGGYYLPFRAFSLFSESASVSRALARHVAHLHSVTALVGMASMTQPAYEELLAQGLKTLGDPTNDFYELDALSFQPFVSKEGLIRPMEPRDVDPAARLSRLLQSEPSTAPVDDEERRKILSTSLRFCLEMNGRVVSMASSNGLCVKAFQILGVATDPSFQRKGFARAVCSHLISFMFAQGATKAVLFTGQKNVAAQHCYTALGFQITDRYYVGRFQV